MHGLAVYVKEGLPFARDLSLENSADSYLCFRLALLHSVSHFFFLYQSPSSSLCTVFDSIYLIQMTFSPSACLLRCLSLEALTSVMRTGSSILVELIELANSIIKSQMTLLRWLTFLLGSLTVTVPVLLIWIYLFLLVLVFLQWLSIHGEILIMWLSQFPLTFCQTQIGMLCFIT